jgi:hypothetical protein
MNLFEDNGADFSECRKYRYALWRIWDKTLPKAMCIGLNPSTANETKNDNTISVLKIMLTKLGFGGFYMTNLFAWISSKPEDLLTCEDALGDNDNKLSAIEKLCDEVIFCWGSFKQAQDRVKCILPNYSKAKCFGKSKNGMPLHPRALIYNGTLNNPQLIKFQQ